MFPVRVPALVSVSMSGDIFSAPIPVGNFSDWSVHFRWIGDPDGVVYVEGTNFPPTDNVWDTIADTNMLTGSADGKFLIERIGGSGIEHIRLRYDRTAGDGTLSARFFGQGR